MNDISVVQVHANMGYCPQFDALIDVLTVRETLVLFSRLRGIPAADIQPTCDKLIHMMGLDKHVDKLFCNLR
jgi:ATP-binding cassette subfamily A (ABC1) protein 3